MKKIITILLCLLACNQVIAQLPQVSPDDCYYADGVAHYWTTDFTSANIIIGNMENYWTIVERLEALFSLFGEEVLADDEDDNIIVNSSSLLYIPKEMLIADICVSAGDKEALKQPNKLFFSTVIS